MPRAIAILAAILTVALSSPTKADPLFFSPFDLYAGAMGGYGTSRQTVPTETAQFASYQRAGTFFGGFAGIGFRPVAVEVGWLSLPRYHAYAVATDPARATQQTIRSDAKFARALVRAPADWIVRPYAFAGAARVTVANHEIGNCTQCGVGYVPDYQQTIVATRPYVGAGVEIKLIGPFSARGELGYIPRVTQSGEHIGPRDYYLGSLAIMARF